MTTARTFYLQFLSVPCECQNSSVGATKISEVKSSIKQQRQDDTECLIFNLCQKSSQSQNLLITLWGQVIESSKTGFVKRFKAVNSFPAVDGSPDGVI